MKEQIEKQAIKEMAKDKTQHSILDHILETMRNSGKSINQIAKESGVSRTTIHSWQNEKSGPTIFSAEAVLKTVGYTLIISKTESNDAERKIKGDTLST